jgi:small redox-active disulfide protein 2
MKIEILGTGCAKCESLFANARAAVDHLALDAEVVKVKDIQEILARDVFVTPALVVDGAVKASGRVPSVAEIEGLIA